MTKIKYYDGYTEIEIEVEDSFANVYAEIENESKREEWRDDWRRRRKLSSLEELDEFGDKIADGKPTPEDEAIESETRENLHKAIARLLSEQQELIYRVYFNGESQTDIAREQGVTKKAINNRLSRILENLKKYLN